MALVPGLRECPTLRELSYAPAKKCLIRGTSVGTHSTLPSAPSRALLHLLLLLLLLQAERLRHYRPGDGRPGPSTGAPAKPSASLVSQGSGAGSAARVLHAGLDAQLRCVRWGRPRSVGQNDLGVAGAASLAAVLPKCRQLLELSYGVCAWPERPASRGTEHVG